MSEPDPLPLVYDTHLEDAGAERRDEQRMVAGVRAGDREAFETIYRTYYRPLVGFIYPYLGSEALAEEQVQELFLALWRLRADWQLRTTLRAYLYRGARNRALNYLKHARVEDGAASALPADEPSYGMGQPPAAIDDAAVAGELAAAVRRALQRLPRRCRMTFQLSRDHGLSYPEIAHAMGVSEHTVKIQMSRALKAMREALAPWLS